ncbi:MAG: flippase [Ruminococcaceae bacterium]|nr:flippase [Oscillospiraceae bacterium]
MITKILKNKTFKNAGWLIGGKVVQMMISLVVGLLTARYLGPSNYGLINYAAAYTAFFSSFCTLGINSVLVKEFVDNRGSEGKVIGTALVLKAMASFLSAVTVVCIVSIVDAGETETILVVGLSSLGLIFHIFETINYLFQSHLQSKVTAIASLVAYTLTAVYKVILLITGQSVAWFAFATSVDYICVGIILLVVYRKYYGERLAFSFQYGKQLLSKSYHFILPSLMVAIYGQTDKIMLKQMISDAEIGYYSTALAVCSMWCFVLSAIIDSMYPSIMEAHKKDEEMFAKRNRQLYAIIFYVSVVVSLILTAFAEWVILLLYGEAYLPSVSPLRIVTWYTAFSYLGVARNAWIVCKEKQKYLKYVYFSAALANVVLNLVFIPLWGASGAAVASLVAQVLTTMVVPFFIKGLRENSKLMIEAIFLKRIK